MTGNFSSRPRCLIGSWRSIFVFGLFHHVSIEIVIKRHFLSIFLHIILQSKSLALFQRSLGVASVGFYFFLLLILIYWWLLLVWSWIFGLQRVEMLLDILGFLSLLKLVLVFGVRRLLRSLASLKSVYWHWSLFADKVARVLLFSFSRGGPRSQPGFGWVISWSYGLRALWTSSHILERRWFYKLVLDLQLLAALLNIIFIV